MPDRDRDPMRDIDKHRFIGLILAVVVVVASVLYHVVWWDELGL